MIRSNHYEAAFEAYLQWHRLCYVAVDETRRSYQGEVLVKNLDFIVYGECGSRLLVDVKGRRFPGGTPERPRRVWECWTTRDDIDGLLRWQDQFGPGFRSLLVFTYHLPDSHNASAVAGDLWTWRGRRYVLRAVLAEDYFSRMRPRSPKWETVCLSSADFAELSRPFHYFTDEFYPSSEDVPF